MPDIITSNPLNAHASWEALRETITPTEAFYCRNHYAFPEPPRSLRWGRRQLTTADLRALPQTEIAATLECAGNARTSFEPLPPGTPWGLRGLSTARFSGVLLRDVLTKFPPASGYSHIVFQGADTGSNGIYTRSLSLQELAELNPLLALDMNGEPLLLRYGGPIRLIVPGYFAMASVKWLEGVTFTDQPSGGYYQAMDYQFVPAHNSGLVTRPVTWMLAKSLITFPLTGATVGSELRVEGKAWGGRSPVVGVRVKVGSRAVEATLGEDLGRWAWRPFEATVKLEPGDHALRAFCRLQDEEQQPLQAPWNEQGYENNSAHCVHVSLS